MMILVAHYGGIDEIGIFLVPAVLAVLLLRWAEKRAKARREQEPEEEKVDVD